jgi:hypothetical protein
MLSRPVSVSDSPDDLVFKSGDLLSISRLNRCIGSLATQRLKNVEGDILE